MVNQPLKWHGGKHYLSKKIIRLMPKHKHYVEPFFGGGAVLLNKNSIGVSEVANDIHLELTTFWRVLQNVETFQVFKRIIDATPFSEVERQESLDADPEDPVNVAVKFFVRCRQSEVPQVLWALCRG